MCRDRGERDRAILPPVVRVYLGTRGRGILGVGIGPMDDRRVFRPILDDLLDLRLDLDGLTHDDHPELSAT